MFEEAEKFGDVQEALMRADDIEEESKFGKFECNDKSVVEFISENESVFEEKGRTIEFLSDFRRRFSHQSTSENGRKKMHEEIALDSSAEREIEDVKELFDY